MQSALHNPELHAVTDIRREWIIACGGVTFVVVLSLWSSPLWQPLFEAIVALVIFCLVPYSRSSHSHPCGRLAKCVIYALIITAIISFAINLFFHTDFILYFFDRKSLNESLPYITPLIIFPAISVVSSFNATKGVSDAHSRKCYLHNEYNPGQPHFGRAVHGVYRGLLSYLALISLAVAVVDWFYYSFFYQNINLNTPDRFFFFVLPSAVYIWSLFYIREHYTSVLLPTGRPAVGQSTGAYRITDKSILRFLIIHNDRLLLSVSATTLAECLVDTPVIEYDALDNDYPIDRAKLKLSQLSGLSPDDFSIKTLFTSPFTTNRNKVYHYLVNIPDEVILPKNNEQSSLLSGEWTTLDGIDRFMKMGVLSPVLNAEIYRVYTVTMAWKAYDRQGRRRYPIRRYRPTFRLRDAHKWDVDYEDPIWMKISRTNQDSAWWFISRFFISKQHNQDKCQ